MKFWSRGSNFCSSQRGIQVIRVQVSQVKMTAKWGEIKEKWDLVWVRGEFKLSGFYCSCGLNLPLTPGSLAVLNCSWKNFSASKTHAQRAWRYNWLNVIQLASLNFRKLNIWSLGGYIWLLLHVWHPYAHIS